MTTDVCAHSRRPLGKLIVAASRIDQTKAPKHILQAHTLIQALATARPAELKRAWELAWESGNRWREKLQAGRQRLPAESQAILRVAPRGGTVQSSRNTTRRTP